MQWGSLAAAGGGFYPGGKGSAAPALGACCRGFDPSVGAAALLLPSAPPEAFASPGAGEEEANDEDVVLVEATCAGEVHVEDAAAGTAAAASSVGLAAEEDESGACGEAGRGWEVPFGTASGSGTVASWLQSSRSSVGSSMSTGGADDGSWAVPEDSPLTAGELKTM